MLSWACAGPKVQGLSLNSAVISFDLKKLKIVQSSTDVCCS